MVSLPLPHPPFSPPFLLQSLLTNHGWETQSKHQQQQQQEEKKWRRRERVTSIPSSLAHLLLIRPFIYPSSQKKKHCPVSVSLSSMIFECIIWTCHSRLYDVLIYCQIASAYPCCHWNKSQWSRCDGTAGCVSLCLVCACRRTTVSRHGTIITLPPLKMGSCAPFWQRSAGPGAWLCAHGFIKGEKGNCSEGNEG